MELCSHSVEKTKQCHSDSSVFQSGDLMRKKNIHLKVPFRKRGRAVTLSDDASFLSAILNEGPELSFTCSLSLMPLLLYCMHTHRKSCTHAYTLSHPCTDANCSKMLMPVIILETPLSSLQQHSFRVHRSERKVSWLLLIGQTDGPLPTYELTLTTHAGFSQNLCLSLH